MRGTLKWFSSKLRSFYMYIFITFWSVVNFTAYFFWCHFHPLHQKLLNKPALISIRQLSLHSRQDKLYYELKLCLREKKQFPQHAWMSSPCHLSFLSPPSASQELILFPPTWSKNPCWKQSYVEYSETCVKLGYTYSTISHYTCSSLYKVWWRIFLYLLAQSPSWVWTR